MSKDITKTIRVISAALDAAFQRALEQEKAEGELTLDINKARLVIFSDQHKGRHQIAIFIGDKLGVLTGNALRA